VACILQRGILLHKVILEWEGHLYHLVWILFSPNKLKARE
jgi:hypothetical protein